MTGGLPRGLIAIENNPVLEQEYEKSNEEPRLDVSTIAKTWRVYSASSNVLEADTGNRLQNLFWRTWSSPVLLRKLHPTTFTNIVHLVGTGGGRVQVPRQARNENHAHAHEEDDSTPVPSGPPTATASPVQASITSSCAPTSLNHARQSPNQSAKSPQSILKKSSTAESYGEPTEAFPSLLGPSHRESTGSSSSNAENLSPASSKKPRMKRQISGGAKKASFVANTSGRSKIRPGISRKESSQGTAPQGKERQKDLSRSPIKSPVKSPLQVSSGDEATQRVGRALPPGLAPPPGLPGAKSAVFQLPSVSSWQSVESSPNRSGQELIVRDSVPLIDPDFRKQFIEARSTSHINLVAVGARMRKTGSVVRFVEDLPEFGKTKSRQSPPTSAPSPRRSSLSSSENVAIEDSDKEEEQDGDDNLEMLPRTRSQLSMAIQDQRRISGSRELGPADATNEGQLKKSKGKGKGKETDKDDTEDELLSMARRDGVTKAGGARSRLPLRTSPSSQQRYRSPTPPPIF